MRKKKRETRPYIYAVLPDGVLRWWTGSGWTTNRKAVRRFSTDAQAEKPLRDMMLNNIKAKIGRLPF